MAVTTCSRQLAAPLNLLLEKDGALQPARVTLLRGSAPSSSLSARTSTPCIHTPRNVLRTLALATDTEFSPQGSAPVEEGSKLYVGNLPWNVDSAALAEIFQDAGVVEEVEVMCDRDTGRSRGFAFVVMASPEDAQAAIERFDGSDLGGRSLRVNFPTPRGEGQRRPREARESRPPRAPRQGGAREDNPNKLYVGNLSWGVDDAALQDLFSEFGRVLEARVVTDRDTGRSRGFGFVTLASETEVGQAVSNLDGAEFDGRQIRVNPASQKPGF